MVGGRGVGRARPWRRQRIVDTMGIKAEAAVGIDQQMRAGGKYNLGPDIGGRSVDLRHGKRGAERGIGTASIIGKDAAVERRVLEGRNRVILCSRRAESEDLRPVVAAEATAQLERTGV